MTTSKKMADYQSFLYTHEGDKMTKHLQKWFACLALLLLPMTASASLKFKDCILDGHILFKEYLVAGSAATPFNEFRMFTQESTCGLDVWDLTLNDAQQVSSSNGVSVFSTVYDGGFAGVLNAPANYALWSVSGTGTTTVDTTNNSVNTVMDLVGVSLTDPSMVERLLLGFNVTYSSTPTGNECFEWVSQPCTSYDYLGGDLAYGPASSHAGALRVEVVPEPATGLLLATGLAGLAALRQRRKPR